MINPTTKKAAVGSTLTWVAATFIIFFILVIYLVFLAMAYAGSSPNASMEFSAHYSRLLATQEILRFLESKSNKGLSMHELILMSDEKDGVLENGAQIFQDEASKFLSSSFPVSEKGPFIYTHLKILSFNQEKQEFEDVSGFYVSDSDVLFVKGLKSFTDSFLIEIPLAENKKIELKLISYSP